RARAQSSGCRENGSWDKRRKPAARQGKAGRDRDCTRAATRRCAASFIPTDVGLDSPGKVALQGPVRLARYSVVHSGGNEPDSGSPNVNNGSRDILIVLQLIDL